jgi:hypothetical protein
MRMFIFVFIIMLNCTRYVVERRQYGLNEDIVIPEKHRIEKIDTVLYGEGFVKKVLIRMPEKDKR